MLRIFLLHTPHYPVPIVLAGSLLLAAFVMAIVTALDYRTWYRPGKGRKAPKEGASPRWNSQARQGGCIAFLMSMMALICLLSAVLLMDNMGS